MAPAGPPFMLPQKGVDLGSGRKGDVIGHFQKARLVGKLEHGCLVCYQTPDNLIWDLIN